MSKLIKVLAASVGGGIALGAGIRLGEAIAGRRPAGAPESSQNLFEKLDEVENRLLSLERGFPVEAIEAVAETAQRLRGELRGWLEESVAARLAEVEAQLRGESERNRREMLDTVVEGVQTRVIQRISTLENEVAGQSAALAELRDCSLRTERSVQQLLGGLDRLIVRQPAPNTEQRPEEAIASPAGNREPERRAAAPGRPEIQEGPAQAVEQPPPSFAAPPGRSRWKIFG